MIEGGHLGKLEGPLQHGGTDSWIPSYRAFLLLRHEKPQIVSRRRYMESGQVMVISSSRGYRNFTAQDEEIQQRWLEYQRPRRTSHICRVRTKSLDLGLQRLSSVWSIGKLAITSNDHELEQIFLPRSRSS